MLSLILCFSTMLRERRKGVAENLCHVCGLCSLRNHELTKFLLFISYPATGMFFDSNNQYAIYALFRRSYSLLGHTYPSLKNTSLLLFPFTLPSLKNSMGSQRELWPLSGPLGYSLLLLAFPKPNNNQGPSNHINSVCQCLRLSETRWQCMVSILHGCCQARRGKNITLENSNQDLQPLKQHTLPLQLEVLCLKLSLVPVVPLLQFHVGSKSGRA